MRKLRLAFPRLPLWGSDSSNNCREQPHCAFCPRGQPGGQGRGSWVLPPRASFRLTRCKQQNGPGHLSSHVGLGKLAEATRIWGSLPALRPQWRKEKRGLVCTVSSVAGSCTHAWAPKVILSCPHPFPKHTASHPATARQPLWLQFCTLQGKRFLPPTSRTSVVSVG